MSGITPARKAIAPTLTEEPKGQDPHKAFNARMHASMAKAGATHQQAQDDAAGEDAASPPKAKESSTSKAASAPDGKSAPASGSKSTDTSGKTAAKENETSSSKEQPASSAETERRYDVQSLRKWAEKNPEEAALVREKVFGLPADTNQEWIRLKNRERKLKEGINSERERTVAEAKAERQAAEEAKAAIDQAAVKLGPIADLWEAVAEKVRANPESPEVDFDAADAAFQENTGVSIDDYMRARARRHIGGGTEGAKLRAENARLKRELAGKPSDAIKPKAAAGDESEAAPAAAAVPPKSQRKVVDWSGEVAEDHKVRQLEGWNALVDTEMRRHHDPDLDEYSADPDEIANTILKREIARMMEDEAPEETPKPKPKANGAPKPNGQGKPKVEAVPNERDLRPKLTASDDDDDAKVGGMTWAQRQSRAIDRAMRRARGELE